jgi:hypothetical protein
MKITILMLIFALGIVMPLVWVTGTSISALSFLKNCFKSFMVRGPELGMTMADGGEKVKE